MSGTIASLDYRRRARRDRRTTRLTTVTDVPTGEFLIQTSDDVNVFANVWPTLSALADTRDVRSYPFQCRDHLEIWFETIGVACGIRPVFINVSGKNGDPLMLIPLGIENRAGIRVLAFLDSGVADYNAPVVYRAATSLCKADVWKIWNSLRDAVPAFDIAVLEKMPHNVADFKNPLSALASETWPQSGHIVLLNTGTETLLQSKSQARDGQRCRKRLSEVGELHFHIARDETESSRAFDAFVRQKSRRYHETLGASGFNVPGQLSYYLTLTRRLLGSGVHLSWLGVGEDIVATAWCLIAGSRFYYMMCAYEDGFWSKFSPGRLLLEDLIDWSRTNGLEAFDFGIGDESYKLRWHQTSLELFSATQARTLKGQLYCAIIKVRSFIKHLVPAAIVQTLKGAFARGCKPPQT